MKKLTVDKAHAFLTEALRLNPGPWGAHSRYAAAAARIIAGHIGLDPDLAEAYGIVHDIGRRNGVTQMRHAVDGYEFMMREGYPGAARICLTHSFPTFCADEALGEWDCTAEEYRSVEKFLSETRPDTMDRLIQMCDALAMPTGFTVIDRRLIDVALRYGVDENTTKRRKAFFKIQIDFESRIGRSVYSLLPGIEKNALEPTALYMEHICSAKTKTVSSFSE